MAVAFFPGERRCPGRSPSKMSLRVLVRVCPTIGDEVSLDQAVTCPTGEKTVRGDKHEITCEFDGVLAPTASQTEVYSKVNHADGSWRSTA